MDSEKALRGLFEAMRLPELKVPDLLAEESEMKVYDDINDYIASGGEMKPGGIVPVKNINVPIKPIEPAYKLHVPCETCGHQVSFLFNGSCEDCYATKNIREYGK